MSPGATTLAGVAQADAPSEARGLDGSRMGARTKQLPNHGHQRCLAGLSLLLILLSVLAGHPLLLLVGAVLGCTSAMMRRMPGDLAVPVASCALLAATTAAGVLAAALDVDLMGAEWAVAALAAALPACVLRLPRRVGGARWLFPSDGDCSWVAYLPSMLAVSAGLLTWGGRHVPSWLLSSTDPSQHALFLAEIQRVGVLSYASDGYPRAMHMLAAIASSIGAPMDNGRAFVVYDLRLVGGMTWLALAVVLWTGATLTLRLGRSLGLRHGVSVLAATAVGVVPLLSYPFLGMFVGSGAAPSLLAIVVMWVLPLTALALSSERPTVMVAVGVVSFVLLAHLWQPLVLMPVGAAAAFLATPANIRTGIGAMRGPSLWRARPWIVGAITATALAVGLPPFIGVQRAGGVSLAAIPGQAPEPSWLLVVVGILLLPVLARTSDAAAARTLIGGALGLAAAGAILLIGADGGFDLAQYYPMKVAWFLQLLLLPLVALAGAAAGWYLSSRLWTALGTLGAAARVARISMVAVGGAALVAFVLPVYAAHGSLMLDSLPGWGENSKFNQRAVIALDHGTRYAPAVTVPIALTPNPFYDTHGAYVVSKLISLQTGQPQNLGSTSRACDEVAFVAGDGPAVVITALDPDLLRPVLERQGCGEVPVVQIPIGGDAQMFFFDELGNEIHREED